MTTLAAAELDLLEEIARLPMPTEAVETPCLVVLEDGVLHNCRRAAASAGGVDRLMPHVKTHRALWINRLLVAQGIGALKAATPAEVEISLQAGARTVLWAYPTANPRNIARVADAARRYPDASVRVLFDGPEGYRAWTRELSGEPARNVSLVVDLDPGLGRTGAPVGPEAGALARRAHADGLFAGWHVYDGHIQDVDRQVREDRIHENARRVRELIAPLAAEGLSSEVVAGGSWSFDIWPRDLATYVTPGSFVYSSAHHQRQLLGTGWRIGAFVLASVISARAGSVTLDAGSKAISPDSVTSTRFVGGGTISAMTEEHSVVHSNVLRVGDRVALVPRHACTTAYLYPRALVRTLGGRWEYREQLGSAR